jgi:hypothetical protein
MRHTAVALFLMVWLSGAAHAAEWILCAILREHVCEATSSCTEEAKCQVAAQALAHERNVPTRCAPRVWRIYWLSAPTSEALAQFGVRRQHYEPSTEIFKTRPPRSDVPSGQCNWEMTHWP